MSKEQENTGFSFAVGDDVVYPSHGVGRITAEEEQNIAGNNMHLYVIEFADEKKKIMTLRVPKRRATESGLRPLCTKEKLKQAVDELRKKPKTNRGMWSRRAQDYEAKIHSGDPVAIAKVLRDLHKNVDDPERSFSERKIYDLAMERLVNEYAATHGFNYEDARSKLVDILDESVILVA